MNKIEKLIKEMCPNGVEYKKIKEFSNMFNGMNGVSNKWKDTGNCKFIDYMNCFKNFRIDVSKIHNATVKKLAQNQILYNDILFTASSETKDECCISGVIDNEIPKNIFLDDHLFLIRIFEKFKNEINSIFLNYYFHSISFRNDVNKIVRGLTRFYVSKIDFMEIQIPIPPIEIQNEIVKILDTFTQLEAELEAELEARDKQYQYYRNKLLDFDNNQKLLQKLFEKDNKEIDNRIYYNKLKDVFDIKNGFTPSKNNNEFWENGTIPWFKLDDIRSNGRFLYDSKIKVNEKAILNKKVFKSNSIIISTTETNGEKALIKTELIFNQQFTVFSLNNVYEKLVIPKFVFYYFFNISNMLKNKTKNINLPIININEINNMNIPIPSLEIQRKIVNILDKLQDYSKDIKTGLPLEIDQRQKQYEYYRNLLLDFKANAQGGGISE